MACTQTKASAQHRVGSVLAARLVEGQLVGLVAHPGDAGVQASGDGLVDAGGQLEEGHIFKDALLPPFLALAGHGGDDAHNDGSLAHEHVLLVVVVAAVVVAAAGVELQLSCWVPVDGPHTPAQGTSPASSGEGSTVGVTSTLLSSSTQRLVRPPGLEAGRVLGLGGAPVAVCVDGTVGSTLHGHHHAVA